MPTRDEMNSASGAFLSPFGLQGYHGSENSASPATEQRRGTQGNLERYGDIIRLQVETIGRQNERIAALESELVDKAAAITWLEEHISRLGRTAQEFESIARDRARVIADLRRVNGDLTGKLLDERWTREFHVAADKVERRMIAALPDAKQATNIDDVFALGNGRLLIKRCSEDIGLFLGVPDFTQSPGGVEPVDD